MVSTVLSPKLGVVFPTLEGEDPLIAFPLVLPMGWKNSPPIFCTATETIADLANARLRANVKPAEYPLDELAESVPSPSPLDDTTSEAVETSSLQSSSPADAGVSLPAAQETSL